MSRLVDRLSHIRAQLTRKSQPKNAESDNERHRFDYTADSWTCFLNLTCDGLYEGLPVGMLVVMNFVTCDSAGPSAVLSVALAALLGGFIGLALCELRSRAASLRYGRSFECLCHLQGEWAGLIGASLSCLEAILLTSLTAQASAYYLDAAIGNKIQKVSEKHHEDIVNDLPLNFLACAFIIVMGVSLCVRRMDQFENSKVKMTITVGLMLFCLFLFVTTASHRLHFENWGTAKKFFPGGANGVFEGTASLTFVFVRSAQRICSSSNFMLLSYKRITLLSLGCVLTILLACLSAIAAVITLLDTFDPAKLVVKPGSTCLEVAFSSAGLDWIKYILGLICLPVLLLRSLASYREAVAYPETLALNNLLCKVFADKFIAGGMAAVPVAIMAFVAIICTIFYDGYFTVKSISLSVLFQVLLAVNLLITFHYRPNEALETNNNRRGVSTVSETTEIQVENRDQQRYGTTRPDGDSELIGRSDDSDQEDDVDAAVLEYRLTTAAIKFSNSRRANQTPTKRSSFFAVLALSFVNITLVGTAIALSEYREGILDGVKSALGAFLFFVTFSIISSIILARKPTDHVTRDTLLVSLPVVPFAHTTLVFITMYLITFVFGLTTMLPILWLVFTGVACFVHKLVALNSIAYNDFGRENVQVVLSAVSSPSRESFPSSVDDPPEGDPTFDLTESSRGNRDAGVLELDSDLDGNDPLDSRGPALA